MAEEINRTLLLPDKDAAGLERGLLPVFRLIVGVHLGFMVVAGLATIFFEHERPDTGLSWVTGWLVILTIYLWWPGLSARLGRLFLPIALAISTVGALVDRVAVLYALADFEPQIDVAWAVIATGWQLVLVLFLPLTLIAWQYRYLQVVMFAVATAIVEIAIAWMTWRLDWGDPWGAFIAVTMGRTVLFLIIGYVVTRMMGEQREQRARLSEANERLVHYAATAESLAVSHERNRLARELHDTLAHTLSSLSVQLEAIDSVWGVAPDQAHLLLTKARANAHSGLSETRRALRALRASPLEDLGLILAVRNLAESTAARNGLTVETELSDEIDGLMPEVEQGIYRTTQEALANSVKHAMAQRVVVSLSRSNGNVVLQIDDDGKGFDVAALLDREKDDDSAHYGLRGLEERASMIGGELSITSKPGEGTTLRLETPIG